MSDLNVEIKLFAVARQLAGCDRVATRVPQGSTIGDVRARLAAEYPDLAPLLPHVLFAIGSEYVGDEQPVADGDAIACIPPVSGG